MTAPPAAGRFRRNGIHGRRIRWAYPWCLTAPWTPSRLRGADEWCNPTTVITVPPFGAIVVYPQRPARFMPCPARWNTLTDQARADYAPCGRLYAGHYRPAAHHHTEEWPCPRASLWLQIAAPEP
jgi:hypothetical protein